MQEPLRSGWLFPDSTVSPITDIQNTNWHAISAMWFHVSSTGTLVLRNAASHGQFHYNATRAQIVRDNSSLALVNVSCANPTYMHAMCYNTTKRPAAINTLIDFVTTNNLDGVDIDFEGFASFGPNMWTGYKVFLTELGNALHNIGKVLYVEVPPIWNNTTTMGTGKEWMERNSQGYYPNFKYESFNTIPVDKVVIMAYDYHYDMTVGTPNQPLEWLRDILKWAKTTITDDTRIVAGLPVAGYGGTTGSYAQTGAGYDWLVKQPGFNLTSRDASSSEIIWQNADKSYALIDQTALEDKIEVCVEEGIGEYMLWHIGGNLYGKDV